jgi:hypothetical protein
VPFGVVPSGGAAVLAVGLVKRLAEASQGPPSKK